MNDVAKKQYLDLMYEDLRDFLGNDFQYIYIKDIILSDVRRENTLKDLHHFQVNPYLNGVLKPNDDGWETLKKDIKERVLAPFVLKVDENGYWIIEGLHRFIMIEELIKAGELPEDIKLPCSMKGRNMKVEHWTRYSSIIQAINRISSTLEDKYYPPSWMRYD